MNQIKSGNSLEKETNVTELIEIDAKPVTHIKTFENSHHSIESTDKIIPEQKKIENFKSKNVHGHSSDSKLQDILYNWIDEAPSQNSNAIDNIQVEKQIVEASISVEKEISPAKTPLKQTISDQTVEAAYKSSIRMQANMNATTLSPLSSQTKSNIKLNENFHHSHETDEELLESIKKNKILMFKQRNLHGHSSDSQMQQIIYKSDEADLDKANRRELDQLRTDEAIRSKNFAKFTNKESRIDVINFDDIIVPYEVSFEFEANIYQSLLTDKLRQQINVSLDTQNYFEESEFKIERESAECEHQSTFSFNYINLKEILDRLLCKPIQIQAELVNKCVLNYFLFELNLEEHLTALRMYMFCEDSEFSQVFIDEIAEKILFATNYTKSKHAFLFENQLNPVYVNEALDKAISSVRNTKFVHNISIRLDYEKNKQQLQGKPKQHNSQYQTLMFLNCLELKYKLSWPLNIIITEKCLANYNKVFEFLLQIKLVQSALNNVWHTLKRFGKFVI